MARDRRPLVSYLRVQMATEKELDALLRKTSRDLNKQLLRRAQLEAAREAVDELFRGVNVSIKAGQANAASAAIEVAAVYEDVLLKSRLTMRQRVVLLDALKAQAERGVAVALTRHVDSHLPLSKQVYRTRALANNWVGSTIESGMARGLSARELAAEVSRFINPRTPGGVSFAAKRLARTELNNAFHAITKQKGIDTPWITGMRWNLSGSHTRPDECNEYAEAVTFKGGTAGVYKPEQLPQKPHPNCLCFVTYEQVTLSQFKKAYDAGKYDTYIDDVMRKSGYTEKFIAASRG